MYSFSLAGWRQHRVFTDCPRLKQVELFPVVTNLNAPDSSAQNVFIPASGSSGTAVMRNFEPLEIRRIP